MKTNEEVTRIEVIGNNGREFSKWLKDSHYEVSIQDDGRTMKLFEAEKEDGTDISGGQRLNNFQDFGFTADFEGEILKEIDEEFFGWARIQDKVYAVQWNGYGKGFLIGWDSRFDLTPIKKEIQVEKIVAYEFSGQGVVESREVVTITKDYWYRLSKGDLNEEM